MVIPVASEFRLDATTLTLAKLDILSPKGFSLNAAVKLSGARDRRDPGSDARSVGNSRCP